MNVTETRVSGEYVNEKQAATLTGLSVFFLRKLRRVGGGPKFSRISRRALRYAVADLRAWMESKQVET